MSLQTIIVVALRLSGLYWLVQGLVGFVALLPLLGALDAPLPPLAVYSYCILPIGFLLLAAILWWGAPRIAAEIARGYDQPVALTTLTREDLYAGGFVFLGLWFALSSLSPLLEGTGHFLALAWKLGIRNPQTADLLGGWLVPAITMAVGLTSLLGAHRWATRLASKP